MNLLVRKIPTHEKVYRQIRDMILFGDLAPGQAVTIQGLIDVLGAGMTPVREAIRRLSAEGALEPRGNRRIVVPLMGLEQLEQLAFARLAIEPHLAQLSVNALRGKDITLIEGIDDDLDRSIACGDIHGYLRDNYRFHMAIYDLSQAPLLVGLVAGLWLRFGPSLRVVCGQVGTLNLPDRHDQAVAGLRARDGVAVARAIAEDIAQGIDQVRKLLREPEI